MTQLAQNPSYLRIAEMLDEVGQRRRVFHFLRGLLLFVGASALTLAITATVAAIFGSGTLTWIMIAAGLSVILAALAMWVIRPLVATPRPLTTAQLIESRLPDLHNGLTNALLLAQADDLDGNPWLPIITSEIAGQLGTRPLNDAVQFSDLKRPGLTCLSLCAPLLILLAVSPRQLTHGLQQMTHPSAFVPTVGAVEIVDVRPGDTTVIAGRPLGIELTAKGPGEFPASIIFDDQAKSVPMVLATAQAGQRQFTFQHPHVDASTRYRVEAGGTQSRWYSVTAVKQVTLKSLIVIATPPAYTRAKPSSTEMSATDLVNRSLSYPQGSQIQLVVALDVPVSAAMLQVQENAPVTATRGEDGKSFTCAFTLRETSSVAMLLTDGSGQIISRLPEKAMTIQCTTDNPPVIEMKWPAQDLSVAPTQQLRIQAQLRDDYGLSSARLMFSASADEPMQAAAQQTFSDRPTTADFAAVVTLKPEQAVHGQSLWVRVEATDNRDLMSLAPELGNQTTEGKRIEIRFRDPAQIAKEEAQRTDQLRKRLLEMLATQQKLHEATVGLKASNPAAFANVKLRQSDLRTLMLNTAQTFEFDAQTRIIQKTLQVLAGGAAQEAVDYAGLLMTEPAEKQRSKLDDELQSRQRRIIQTLEMLLATLKAASEATTQPAQHRGGDMDNPADAFKKLDEALKEFIKEEKRILDQTAMLAKKPVDNFDDADRKLLEDLKASQDKLDAFMQEKVHDFSNVAEQDMANSSLLKELLEVYSETTMAKNALKDKAMEIAVSAEEMGLELAKETSSNLEKWLENKPDRTKWTQEDQPERAEAPMPELPAELEDMIGELMEQQEDLFEEMEDANANWHDSADKGAGWGAADGPIDNMSAKGVTGNVLPNANEIGGRSGEGRSGQSHGEFVEESAVGKGGRNTPTRLDPTPFEKGQVKDTSTDPVGGATGGGKLSGQGGAGLEGPLAPVIKQQMERLATKQAELRNTAERMNLQYRVGRYDNFKLLESIAMMRRVESDLHANRYQTALRRKDVTLDAMDASRTLLGGKIAVQNDSTPAPNRKLHDDIHDSMKGPMPPAWESALKEYYRKLSQE